MSISWKLLDMRARIRLIDTQLIVLLARRFEIMREVRAYKKKQGLPLVDHCREREVLDHCRDLARSLEVPEELVSEIYSRLFEHVRGPIDQLDLTSVKDELERFQQNAGQPPGNSGAPSEER